MKPPADLLLAAALPRNKLAAPRSEYHSRHRSNIAWSISTNFELS
jgi:hypothetical protein